MNKTDIERMRAQLRRTLDEAEELVEDADTIGEAGFSPSNSTNVLQKQRDLTEDVGQVLADFNELLARANKADNNTREYAPTRDNFSIVEDTTNNEITISYNGSETVPLTELTVTKAGSEITPFSSDLNGGESAIIDVSGLSDGDLVEVEFTQHNVDNTYPLRSWDEVLGQTDAVAPSVSSGSLTLPDHQLTKMSRTVTVSETIGTTQV